MHLEIAVVAVGLAGQQAFDLHRLGLRADRLQVLLGLDDDRLVALGVAELDQHQRLVAALRQPLDLSPLLFPDSSPRSEERRGRKEGVSTCRSRWSENSY